MAYTEVGRSFADNRRFNRHHSTAVINSGQWNIARAQRIDTSRDMREMDDSQRGLLLTLCNEFQKFGAVMALRHICHLKGRDADCLPNPVEEANAIGPESRPHQ
ncbi:MAG: hypothetical protein Q8R61_07695 [Thiobacillus sp.]|uniref:hypothetical protein n=1 Tax=Thiobacillus sp. TaxID=924 RepID=UPI0027371131|nr:hypothetical protein [Thiobacillus sp.]MDP3584992.1 hypothetical protein [Thiobacillus sp.]